MMKPTGYLDAVATAAGEKISDHHRPIAALEAKGRRLALARAAFPNDCGNYREKRKAKKTPLPQSPRERFVRLVALYLGYRVSKDAA